MSYNIEEDRSTFLKMEYETLFSYYLWSLRNRHAVVTLYISLFSIAAGGCVVILKESEGKATTTCAGVAVILATIGFLFVERLVSNTITSIWACARLNEVRELLRDRLGLGVFRDLAGGIYRKGTFLGLRRYRLRATNLVMMLNSLAASSSAAFALAKSHNIALPILGAIVVLLVFFLLQKVYSNARIDVCKGYLEAEVDVYEREKRIVNKLESMRPANTDLRVDESLET